MSVTTPPTITAAPTPAPQRGDRATFKDRVDAFITWMTAAVAQFNTLATNVYNNALEAFNSATAAASSASAAAVAANTAASTAGAVAWVSGATVTQYAAVISPANASTYRRRTATGSGTVDPSNDPTNYQLLSAYTSTGRPSVDLGNSGTTTQNFDFDIADVYRLTVTGTFTLNVTNLPAARAAEIRSEIINGGAFTWSWGTTITWVKADGTKTTSFSSSGYTLQSAGSSFVVLWNHNGAGPLYGKVV